MRLVLDELGDATIERAGALIAGEHAVARRARPELPASFDHADACSAALQRLLDDGITALSRPTRGARSRS